MSKSDSWGREDAVVEANLLSLPGEIRNIIYEFAAIADFETLVEKMTNPGLLKTSKQLRGEYSDIFFDNAILQIDAYIGTVDTWQQVRNREVKRAIFEDGKLLSLMGFGISRASARRYCRRQYSENVQNGMMTIRTKSGIHRWQWTYPLEE